MTSLKTMLEGQNRATAHKGLVQVGFTGQVGEEASRYKFFNDVFCQPGWTCGSDGLC